MKMEQPAVIQTFYGIKNIKQGNLSRFFRKTGTARASLYFDQPCVLELSKQLSDDDRIYLNTHRKKIAGYFIFVPKGINTAKNMDRYGKTT